MSREAVWVIDDDSKMRLMMEQFLENNEYTPVCFADAESALKALQSEDFPKPRAMLVDLVLKGMWGTEFITAARPYLDNGSPCAFYMITGHSEKVPRDNPAFNDVTIYIKPMDMRALEADLEKTINDC